MSRTFAYRADAVVPLIEAPTSPADYRPLASVETHTIAEAEDWTARNRETWRGALADHETHFQVFVTDDEGEIALTIEHDATFGSEGTRLGRKALRAMRGVS